jgi:hypothetical protein
MIMVNGRTPNHDPNNPPPPSLDLCIE